MNETLVSGAADTGKKFVDAGASFAEGFAQASKEPEAEDLEEKDKDPSVNDLNKNDDDDITTSSSNPEVTTK